MARRRPVSGHVPIWTRHDIAITPPVSPSIRLFRNCGLVTIVSTRPPKRPPSASSLARMASIVASSDGIRLRPRA